MVALDGLRIDMARIYVLRKKNCRERGITRIIMAIIYVLRKLLPCINVAKET